MASAGLVILMLLILGIGALAGLVAVLISGSRRERIDGATAFAWGAVLGPIGIGVVAVVCRSRRSPVAPRQLDVPF